MALTTNLLFQGTVSLSAISTAAEGSFDEVIHLAVQLQNAVERGLDEQEFQEPTKPLNILLLYADDWRHDSLSSAGTQIVSTPFLDRLAQKGIRFTQNCVTTSICWISRATLHTGQWFSRHNSSKLAEPHWYSSNNDTFPNVLRENGYYTGHIGKWNWWYEDQGPTFDVFNIYEGDHWMEDHDNNGAMTHVTKLNEKHGMNFLKDRPKDKPFHLTIAFFAPHSVDGDPEQYLPQKESMTLYADTEVPVPVNGGDEFWSKLPDMFTDTFEGRVRYFMRFDSPEKYQKMMKNYYRLISEVDKACETLVKELERQGILHETLIIFTTDNGYFHAEHGLAGKWLPYQESIRVPLIIQDPRMHPRHHGTLNDDFTLNVDLASTILSAAGIPQRERMQGRDISELYRGKDVPEWRTEFFYEHPNVLDDPNCIPTSLALVSKEYKYIEYPEFNTKQFFHLKKDPMEENDLINDPDYARIIATMEVQLRKLEKDSK